MFDAILKALLCFGFFWVVITPFKTENYLPDKNAPGLELLKEPEFDRYLPKLSFTEGDGHYQDIREPFIDPETGERVIWGPWRDAVGRDLTAYDRRFIEKTLDDWHIHGWLNRLWHKPDVLIDHIERNREASMSRCAHIREKWRSAEELRLSGKMEPDLMALRRLQAPPLARDSALLRPLAGQMMPHPSRESLDPCLNTDEFASMGTAPPGLC